MGTNASTRPASDVHGKPGQTVGRRSSIRGGSVIAATGVSPASSCRRRARLSEPQRADAHPLLDRRLDVERDAVERAAVRRAEAQHGPGAPQVAAGLVEPGQVPRHDRDATRLQRVHEPARAPARRRRRRTPCSWRSPRTPSARRGRRCAQPCPPGCCRPARRRCRPRSRARRTARPRYAARAPRPRRAEPRSRPRRQRHARRGAYEGRVKVP